MRQRPLEGLEAIVKRIDARLSEKERARERTILLSRELVRTCADAIRSLRNRQRSAKLLARARQLAAQMRRDTSGHPELLSSGTVENALQELAEAFILDAIVNGRPLPPPESLDCTPAAYLLGIGDAIGELRRMAQDALRRGNLGAAEELLRTMEGLFGALNMFDYPDAIVPLKHKQDVARSLIEKTRGEVAVAVRGRELEQKLAALERVLARHRAQGRRPGRR
ncbi:MAG: haloacid dehalogenase [Thermoplasmata archaeon]